MVTESAAVAQDRGRRFSWLHVLGFVLLAIVITVVATVWIVRSYIFPSEFTPVTLSAKEEQVLDAKLERLESVGSSPATQQSTTEGGTLQPEKYSEEGARRDVEFSEKEVNALVAKNTDLAQKLAIDLSDNLVSAKLLVPVDEDFPILGGKTLRVKAGMELAYDQGKPIVVLKGVSVMGVPIPNAWLGGLKNIDLVREFGGEEGFWKAFAAGVEHIGVREGRLQIQLKE